MRFQSHVLVLGLVAAVRASPVTMESDFTNAMLSRRWEQPAVPSEWINKSSEMTGEQLIAEYSHAGARALLSRVRNSGP